MNFTPFARPLFDRLAKNTDSWTHTAESQQIKVLRSLLRRAAKCDVGKKYGFDELSRLDDPRAEFVNRVPTSEYEDIRHDVMTMILGQPDVLWPGVCHNFAQSSGTSGGRSKFIPVTDDSLQRTHYRGASYCMASYLRLYPDSKIFSGKGFILGGSFGNKIEKVPEGVYVGDLSATLINRINPVVNMFRVPDKKTALIPDWSIKLPALVKASAYENITNISGVPSWFLTVIKEVMAARGVDKISDAWPNLEVFFHGGISFAPYREIYTQLTDPERMHFHETYNASEGFFAVQDLKTSGPMLLLIDNDVYYEFVDISDPDAQPVDISRIEEGKVYELIITGSNGLWRYRLGDTVRIESVAPVRISIAGRTKCYINAFGEELMQENAEKAMAETCAKHDAEVKDYTAAPVFADNKRKGRHQWFIEWAKAPADLNAFATDLDNTLRNLNSDYDAKRNGTIFLDPLEIISVPDGTFDRWLASVGNHRLGGQRKIPRLSNDRHIADALLQILKQS